MSETAAAPAAPFADVPLHTAPSGDLPPNTTWPVGLDGDQPTITTWPTGFDAERAGTADLTDLFHQRIDSGVPETGIQILEPGLFRDYGGLASFRGRVTTVKVDRDNPGVLAALSEPGVGRVLVVDAGGQKRCAIMGDLLSELAEKRGWAGIIVNGCVRDTDVMRTFAIGVKALAPHPLKPGKKDRGLRDVLVSFGGATIHPGDWIVADSDGIIVSRSELKVPAGAPQEKVPLRPARA